MFLLKWYEEFCRIRFNNRSIKQEFEHRNHREEKEIRICESCETLKQQLEIANYERAKLLDRIMEKPEPVVERPEPPQMTRPRMMPWAIRQQMLEREDRAKAHAQRNAAQPDKTEVTIEDLEKELDVASATREQQSAS